MEPSNQKRGPNIVGQNIKKYRNLKGWTQDELSKKIGKSRTAVNHYENDYSDPPFSIVEKIAKVLEVSILDLLKGEGDNIALVKRKIAELPKQPLPQEYPALELKMDKVIQLLRELLKKFD